MATQAWKFPFETQPRLLRYFIQFILLLDCDCFRPGHASINTSCDDDGQCYCKFPYTGPHCKNCQPAYYMNDETCKGVKEKNQI